MVGQLIVFEGPDAVGKSTLVEYLRARLERMNITAEFLAFPGNSPGTLGKLVYELHHTPEEFGIVKISPLGLQTLHVAAHLDALVQTIIPALTSGRWIVLDRFWWSTWVYGTADEIEPGILDSLIYTEKLLWGGLVPSVLFWIDRTKPLGVAGEEVKFSLLRRLYAKLSASQHGKYEIIHIGDESLESAKGVVEKWLTSRTAE
jgi:thymidylate kinase